MQAKTNWTPEQWEAITTQGCNLLVAAAAGAGKTAVLVERIIQKITAVTDPVDIDRLLVMTFTNAAAAEMRERIAGAIAAVLEGNPGSRQLHRQLTLLNRASITTIHSFCLEVIRSNFQLINIDPGFRIADATEATLMQLEVLDELFADQYEEDGASQEFLELLECYGGNRDDQALQDMVLNLYSFIQSSPWPQQWLVTMTDGFNASVGQDFGDTSWGQVLLDAVMLELEGLQTMMRQAVATITAAAGLEKYLAVYLEDLANLEALARLGAAVSSTRWDAVFDALHYLDFNRLPAAGKDADKIQKDYVQKIRNDVKARIKTIKENLVPAESAAIVQDMQVIYPMMQCLARLVSEFSSRYAARKSKKTVVDFNDLEHFCLAILTEQDEDGGIRPSQAAYGYRERYAEILVDEYQDSNLVQEIIIQMIARADTGHPNVFMVGDVKQSIYRFRQAKPELFLAKYNSYSLEPGNPCRKILLYRNFRSRATVVDAVNCIFQQIMSVRVGELDYTELEALNPGAVFAANAKAQTVIGGAAELHLLQTGGSEDRIVEDEPAGAGQESSEAPPEQEEMLDSIQWEARLIAQRIRELVRPDAQEKQFCVYDQERQVYRPVEYRDVVILLRTTRNWSDVFMEELMLQGIPAFADTGTGFFKTTEVQVILSLLQIIDNPLQDIPLLAVLRSPLVSFTTDDLAELRLADREADLYDALQVLAAGSQGQAATKAARFLHDLHRWRDMVLYLSTDRLIWQLFNETGYYGTVGAMPAGEQRQANLRVLFERARQYEETSYKGLFNFINFIDKLKSSKGDMGSAKILGENDNVVRIMSIHKSKGLEFPVVILAGCGKRFNLQDMNKRVLLHQELGLGPDVVDYRRRLAYPSLPKQAIRERIKAETLSEEMRILYVAMTRAREKLIITGAVSDVPKAIAKWANCAAVQELKLPAYEMLKGGRYLDWIGPALLRHQDCASLRDCAGIGIEFGGQLLADPSQWEIRVWNQGEVASSKLAVAHEASEITRWLEATEEEDDCSEEIARRLGWQYQYARATHVPAKLSVTELKRRFDAELAEETSTFTYQLPVLVKKPLFLEEKKGLSAAETGTVMHFVMQRLNYHQGDLPAQIQSMLARELLSQQQADSVDVDKIQRFLASPLGTRLLASGSVHREVPFNLAIPCHEVYPDLHDEAYQGETLLLQGVIDCYFEEADGIVLLDYKTDYVPAGRVDLLRERYQLQIDYYARALEQLTGKKVKEKQIYLFSLGSGFTL